MNDTIRIHPLTGEPKVDRPPGGHSRMDPVAIAHADPNQKRVDSRKASMSYDAARVGTDMDGHWVHADAYDADTANSKTVRHRLMRNSRYEKGSNGYYSGSTRTHTNLVVGRGPQLRMLTGNREFNQLVEREFYRWAQAVQLRRKLWCLSHARLVDGESFALMVNNPQLPGVQLDLLLLEAEQCQTPYLPHDSAGYVDGIRFDEHNNLLWYDILPNHPGGAMSNYYQDAEPVPHSVVLHWFKLERGGQHRGIPDLVSTLTMGAMNRRMREATVTSVETAASLAMVLQTQASVNNEDPDPVSPFADFPTPGRRGGLTLPMGWQIDQLSASHPNAQYGEFCRQQLSEMASPIGQPYNVAAHDSSTYSFASGKLDTLSYRQAIDIERADCDDLILDRIFAAWFREWTIVADRRDIPPSHQWDWPRHPIIDEVADASAIKMNLESGRKTIRQVNSDDGNDAEDQLSIDAQDWFGEVTEESIAKMRQIRALKTCSQHVIPYVAAILGLSNAAPPADPMMNATNQLSEKMDGIALRLSQLESHMR